MPNSRILIETDDMARSEEEWRRHIADELRAARAWREATTLNIENTATRAADELERVAKRTADELERVAKHTADELDKGTTRMDLQDLAIAENTALTKKTAETTDKIAGDTSILREILEAVRGGLKVLGWLGTGAKWIGGIAVATGAVMTFFHVDLKWPWSN